MDAEGRFVSQVERIMDEEEQKKIKMLIKENGENAQLIQFF